MKEQLVELNRFLGTVNEGLKSIGDFQVALGIPMVYADQSESMMLKFESKTMPERKLKIVVDVIRQTLKEMLAIRTTKKDDYSFMIFEGDVAQSDLKEILYSKEKDFIRFIKEKFNTIETHLSFFKMIDCDVLTSYSSETNANGIVLAFGNKSAVTPYLSAVAEIQPLSNPLKKDALSKKYKILVPYEQINKDLIAKLSQHMPEDYRLRMLHMLFKKMLPTALKFNDEGGIVSMKITKNKQIERNNNIDWMVTILKYLGCEFKISHTEDNAIITIDSAGIFTYSAFEVACSLASEMTVDNIIKLQKNHSLATLYAVLSKVVQNDVKGEMYPIFMMLSARSPGLFQSLYYTKEPIEEKPALLDQFNLLEKLRASSEVAYKLTNHMNADAIVQLIDSFSLYTVETVLSKIAENDLEGKLYPIFHSLYKKRPRLFSQSDISESNVLAGLLLSSAIKNIRSKEMNNLLLSQLTLAWSVPMRVLIVANDEHTFSKWPDLISSIQYIGPILARQEHLATDKLNLTEIVKILVEHTKKLNIATVLTDEQFTELQEIANMLHGCATTRDSMPILSDRGSKQYKAILENIRLAANKYIDKKCAGLNGADLESLSKLQTFLESIKNAKLITMHSNEFKESIATATVSNIPLLGDSMRLLKNTTGVITTHSSKLIDSTPIPSALNFSIFSDNMKILQNTKLTNKIEKYLAAIEAKIKTLSVEPR